MKLSDRQFDFICIALVVALAGGLFASAQPNTKDAAGMPLEELPKPLEHAMILPAKIDRHIDGDTVGVVLSIRATIRLEDCWAAETRTTDPREKVLGVAAAKHIEQLAPLGSDCTVYVPLREGNTLADLFSFGRLIGRVYVSGKNLAREQVRAGHATRQKQNDAQDGPK